jgi:S-adenosylmethionine-dependent methyltransferase
VAEDLLHSRRWTLRTDPRVGIRTAVIWDALDALVAERAAATGRQALDVVDVGGGTGGFAVPLADLGHHVTVVDPSPDALAALQRRAAEAGVADRVTARQGDAATIGDLVPTAGADVVLAHGVLEYVDDPHAATLAALALLRPGGIASLLVPQRLGAVLARAVAGRFTDARTLLDDPDGRAGDADPVPRRFDVDGLLELLEGRPVTVRSVHGVRLVTDLLPGALVDDPATADALLTFERAAAVHPALTAVAAQLHVAVQRSDSP